MPLEAKKAPWKHRHANLERTTALTATGQEKLKKRRDVTMAAFWAERSFAEQQRFNEAERLRLAPVEGLRLDPVDYMEVRTLEDLQAEIQAQMLEHAKLCEQAEADKDKRWRPQLVTIDGKTPRDIYVVCPSSYDEDTQQVDVIRPSDAGEGTESVKWKKCREEVKVVKPPEDKRAPIMSATTTSCSVGPHHAATSE